MIRHIFTTIVLFSLFSILPGCSSAGSSRAEPVWVAPPPATSATTIATKGRGSAPSTQAAQSGKASASTSASSNVKTGNPYMIKGVMYYPLSLVSHDYVEEGMASWYGKDFHGKKTANGEMYDMHAMTAAHKTLPLPTYVRVTNLSNNKQVVVRVNDRGPFSKGRILDLSYEAARRLDMVNAGVVKVRVEVMSQSSDHLRTENRDVDINKGSFAVQIGSFADKNNAGKLAGSFKNAAITRAVVDGNTYYRVQVRGYTTKREAERAAKNFDKNYKGAFVIAD